ncbi:YicC-like family, N-terminal region [Suttonella indologenes]|uniref:YicC-like family, N-terminal region n=2 Tax=Suttonella indologenes TaxID=13276 RepID=A0A380N035_9GAMM|nr:YicC/YloC family endoribonuclease [Suttonella indologenes]SUO98170.1 YicC-like family, N-terminal region [Suttonella indologenes]
MTAFAGSEGSFADFSYSIEIKTVNHRFLEVQVKLPEGMRSIENIIRQKFQQALYRGKVDIWIGVKRLQAGREVSLNPSIMKRWLLAFSDSGVMQSLGKPDWQTMLNLPGVLVESAVDQEELNQAILESLDTAIANLLEMRQREGEQIKQVLLEQLEQIEQQMQTIDAAVPQIERQRREQLQEKIAALQMEINQDRLEQEIVFMLNKSDIREEIDRIRFHIQEARQSLNEQSAIGRKMDFLMQEFNREANTLSAKAGDNLLSKAAVDLKVIIEQMREQVQNLE